MKNPVEIGDSSALLESAVLAGCLLCPWDFQKVSAVLTPSDFADRSNREIYKTLLALHARNLPPDSILLICTLREAGKLSVVQRVMDLLQIGAVGPHLQFYVGELVVKSAARRKSIEVIQSSNTIGEAAKREAAG